MEQQSISSLELQAAMYGTRLKQIIVDEHVVEIRQIFFCTDLTTVLHGLHRADKKQLVLLQTGLLKSWIVQRLICGPTCSRSPKSCRHRNEEKKCSWIEKERMAHSAGLASGKGRVAATNLTAVILTENRWLGTGLWSGVWVKGHIMGEIRCLQKNDSDFRLMPSFQIKIQG